VADQHYSYLDRLLHRLALHYRPIAEVSFDLDQSLVQSDPALIADRRHVFVSGLARAGTTILMRRFHATGRYRSLTYRDMPFVLAPNLWHKLSQMSRRNIERAERAHGDGLLVDADSPESLDEVFWRIFSGDDYIESDRLRPYAPDGEVIDGYVKYVNAILASQPPLDRYLSKNNNNILRLAAIQQAFPQSLIVIPFREPTQHAYSLLRQHVQFSKVQAGDTFTQSYMTWLGHHEFGLDHRPFEFGSDASVYKADTLNYWLRLWCETYEWLERSKPQAALFVGYEDLCTRPETWQRLAQLADISASEADNEPLRLSAATITADFDGALAGRAQSIYDRLLAQSRRDLTRVADKS